MRRKEKEISDRAVIDEILKSCLICRVAFADDYPYIVPMNYGYHENALYFHCATQGRKIDLIRKNSRVGFEVTEKSEIVKDDVACKWTTKFRSVIGFGEMFIICDHEEKKQGLDIIMKQHGKHDSQFDDRIVERALVLKLEIEGLSGKES